MQQIDKVYIDVRQPAERFETVREAMAAGTGPNSAEVEIVTPSGKPYPIKGKLLFSDITVDAGTGNAIVRVLVDNPQQRLLPGMFVRARLPRTAHPQALTIPQQAVARDGAGEAQVSVLDSQGRVHARAVKLGDVVNGRYVVLSGLRAGDTIVVEGQDRVQPGTPVKAALWRAPSAQR